MRKNKCYVSYEKYFNNFIFYLKTISICELENVPSEKIFKIIKSPALVCAKFSEIRTKIMSSQKRVRKYFTLSCDINSLSVPDGAENVYKVFIEIILTPCKI